MIKSYTTLGLLGVMNAAPTPTVPANSKWPEFTTPLASIPTDDVGTKN